MSMVSKMSGTSFILRKIKTIDHSRMNNMINFISKESGKSKLYIRVDLVKNFITRGIGYTDYMKGNYVNLNAKEKKDYLTTKNFYQLINYLNKDEYNILFHDKIIFNGIFKEYLKRDYIDIRKVGVEGLKKFLKGKENVFVKKHNSYGAQGVNKLDIEENMDIQKVYKKLMKNGQYLVEDTLIQHEYLNKINPSVVNNLRLVTLVKDGECHIIAIVLRINRGTEEVISCDDIFMHINEDGTLDGNVADADGNIYTEHPKTKFQFHDMKIPYVKESLEMIKKAALEVPEVRYVGWDVAITENGPAIIEGNYYPSYGLHQYYLLKGKRNVGQLAPIKEILGEEYNNIK